MQQNARAFLPADQLERLIGKPSSEWTVDDLIAVVSDRGIRLLSLMHVGGDGWLKTLDFAPRSRRHLADILRGGERADGSSVFRGMGIQSEASDILLRPRLASAFLDPFSPLPGLAVMCSHAGRDNQPLPESPDTIVRRAFERVRRETGLELAALGELEYFLAKHKQESDIYGADDRGYHATAPFVFGEALRREAMAILGGMGVPMKYGHSEVGYIEASKDDDRIWEQHEIELSLSPLPEAAEAIAQTQWVLRNLAHSKGMLSSFDPIIRKGHAGSGMHFHFSPMQNGEHLGGRAPSGELHEPARWLIGGLVSLGDALMAFGNRSEGSFLRLSQAKEAPNSVCWGEFDRKALVRLPVVARDEHGEPVSPPTVEFRLPDGSAHSHLLLAAVAQAMLFGRSLPDLDSLLERTLAASPGKRRDAAARVPSSMPEIASSLRAKRAVFEEGGVFPPHVIDRILETFAPA
ncbi:MAG: glutamine synthetase [Planctomycetes bacterium]|nr:glutamine synthetase [Planctomycetota bacterium]